VVVGLALLALLVGSRVRSADRRKKVVAKTQEQIKTLNELYGPLGEHFTWAEGVESSTALKKGIDNTPSPEQAAAMKALAANVLDPLRKHLNRPINPSSWLRVLALNRAVGSKDDSQHVLGEAVDFKVSGMASEEVVRRLVASGLPFDQAIWYVPSRGGHVHVSFTTRRANRRETRHAPLTGGYPPWSP